MALWRELDHEGFGAHTEDVEPEHLELPHLGKHDRETSSASHRSVPIEMTWATSMHLNLPCNIALTLGFLVSITSIRHQANLGSREVGVSHIESTSMVG